MGLKAKTGSKKYKEARYIIKNISKKVFSKIISNFEKLTYNSYKIRRPKYERTDR